MRAAGTRARVLLLLLSLSLLLLGLASGLTRCARLPLLDYLYSAPANGAEAKEAVLRQAFCFCRAFLIWQIQ